MSRTARLEHSWVDIDIPAFNHNMGVLSDMAQAKGKQCLLMVKANAYGHGLAEMARYAIQAGAQLLGVGHIKEAILLRKRGITAPVLLFTEPPMSTIPLLYKHSITPVVSSLSFLQRLATELHPPACHIKINTGLNRFGFGLTEVPEVCAVLAKAGINPEGILTHYSSATDDNKKTSQEYAQFKKALCKFQKAGYTPRLVHASNSAATAWYEEYETNLVRLGLAAYGLQPNPKVPLPLRPVLSWHTGLAAVTHLAPGERVGYGGLWTAARKSVIGVMPVGYSDGLRRGPQNQQFVLMQGKRLPIIGAVMMNHTMIDITDSPRPPKVGDIITLLGTQQGETISAEHIADTIRTINEEVTTAISPLLPRCYIG